MPKKETDYTHRNQVIFKQWKAGVKYKDLAAQFNLSQTRIRDIVLRLNHVERKKLFVRIPRETHRELPFSFS
jgi:Mor family transcriptional regulator